MTGITAEKHDSFLTPAGEDRVLMEFSGKELLKGESDASSFPSGGLRATFEARGYTAWDCTVPAFIKDTSLYIPTAFCSYTGETLDKKTPLLRSGEALNKQAMRVLRLLGNITSSRVEANMGPEQEYFLISKAMYDRREDIKITGRTLFGAKPPKGQEMEDHYYGKISQSVWDYMKDLDSELWKLGIFAKTKHNEVAPAQHELAPVYTASNIASDHNQLTMEIMQKVALKHDMVCLLHEKPFAGVNGSGKHNNWSISTNDGINLLNPGKNPKENKQFLLFLVATIKAVDEYADLLLLSAATPSNDHRLGGNEAPPAIFSIFIGEEMSAILDEIETGVSSDPYKREKMQTGVNTLPVIRKDTTDRNRTSPFAFTANKFEFRMVGSSASIACPNYMLNTIMAESLRQIADELEGAQDKEKAVLQIIKRWYREHKKVIFNGNNYSQEWTEESKKRGLASMKSTVDILPAFLKEKNVELFERHHVFSKAEIEARYEILLENYTKTLNIEALTMINMARKQILPACVRYLKDLASTVNEVRNTGLDLPLSAQLDTISEISQLLDTFREEFLHLEKMVTEALETDGNSYAVACAFREKVFTAMEELRSSGDKLETLVGKDYWPLPSYADMLFEL